MGGTFAPAPPRSMAPTFIVSALRDPGSASRPGTALQRVQIVKGWIDNGEAHQQVFEVAGDPHNGASVDLDSCTPQGTGANAPSGGDIAQPCDRQTEEDGVTGYRAQARCFWDGFALQCFHRPHYGYWLHPYWGHPYWGDPYWDRPAHGSSE